MLDWKEINGLWYCYKNGLMLKGWVQDGYMWYYLYPNETESYGITYPMGAMAVDWVEVDSMWYYFYPEKTEKYGITYPKGAMTVEWTEINSKWYYFYPNKTENYGITYPMGAMAVDWVELNSKWYYFLKEETEYNGTTHYKGEMVANTTITINNVSYTFDANGVMQEGSNSLYSDKLLEFLKGWEQLDQHAVEDCLYPGIQAYWTIGYGTTYQSIPSAFPNGLDSTCTEAQANQWVLDELVPIAKKIRSALDDDGDSISQQAFDCLCDIGYNAGLGELIRGNTWAAILSGDPDRITTWIMKWDGADGQGTDGLHTRCKARVNMCLYGIYNSDH